MIELLVQSLELAKSEALIIALPHNQVVGITREMAHEWKIDPAEIIGKKLTSFGTGSLTLRKVQGNSEELESFEITFVPALGTAFSRLCNGKEITSGNTRFLVLIQQKINQEASWNGGSSSTSDGQRLQLALKSTGFATWETNLVTKETYNSPEMYELCGHPVGSRELDFGVFDAHVPAEDRHKLLSHKLAHAPAGGVLLQSRYRFRTRSGKFVWLESIGTVEHDPHTGQPVKLIGFSRNIDPQMMVLEQLRFSERNLKRTQSAARLGSFSLRIASGVSRLTAELASLVGLADAMIHPTLKTLIAMIEPGDRGKFCEALELTKLGHPIKALEIAVTLPTGEPEYLEVTMEPDLDETGRVEAVFGTCQSVTERKSLEDRFHQAQKMEAVGQLTGGIAHDFNNILMVVMGNLQLLEKQVKGDPDALKRIHSSIDAAQKGSDLTRRMLAFSRQQALQSAELPINRLLLGMKDMLNQAMSSVGNIEFDCAEDVYPVRADKTMMETAILNLCINARDAMQSNAGKGKSSLLRIITRNHEITEDMAAVQGFEPGTYVEITVSDTGCGIEQENIEKVFQPFFTTKGLETNSGLGLSMIYGFVKQSGGQIRLESELNVGTSIRIYLPAARQEPVAQILPETVQAPEPPAQQPAPQNDAMRQSFVSEIEAIFKTAEPVAEEGQKLTVLVVEDNDSVREVAAAMIEEMGYAVLSAANGPDGYKIIEANPQIDLLLSDVIMAGGMSGPELAAKAMLLRPALKILFMSGYAPGSVRVIKNLPEAIELVNKPFTRDDLTTKVKRALVA